MTKEEAIKELEEIAEMTIWNYRRLAVNMAIEALQQTTWIPVGDEPPKQKKTYWICTDGGYQCECRWTNANPFWTDLTTDWHWSVGDVPQHSKVVAWKPLPEPYKGGEDNEKI